MEIYLHLYVPVSLWEFLLDSHLLEKFMKQKL